jgi:hypothetical protein
MHVCVCVRVCVCVCVCVCGCVLWVAATLGVTAMYEVQPAKECRAGVRAMGLRWNKNREQHFTQICG